MIFKAFHAIKDKDICERYITGHRLVLEEHGISNITTNNNTWMNNPNIYGIIAINDTGDVIGGIRLQIADGITPLPLQEAVGNMDPNVNKMVVSFVNDGVGELCGLWNSKKVKGFGISLLLTRAGIAMSTQFKMDRLMGICAAYTLEMFKRVGFRVDLSYGKSGYFEYPNKNYRAQVIGVLDLITFSTTAPYDKQRIESLKEDMNQTFEERDKRNLKIKYHLFID